MAHDTAGRGGTGAHMGLARHVRRLSGISGPWRLVKNSAETFSRCARGRTTEGPGAPACGRDHLCPRLSFRRRRGDKQVTLCGTAQGIRISGLTLACGHSCRSQPRVECRGMIEPGRPGD